MKLSRCSGVSLYSLILILPNSVSICTVFSTLLFSASAHDMLTNKTTKTKILANFFILNIFLCLDSINNISDNAEIIFPEWSKDKQIKIRSKNPYRPKPKLYSYEDWNDLQLFIFWKRNILSSVFPLFIDDFAWFISDQSNRQF